MKTRHLLFATLFTLVSCQATLKQKVHKELSARAEEAPVLLLRPTDVIPDSATTIAELDLHIGNAGYKFQDAAKVLMFQTRELGGNIVHINRVRGNVWWGGLGNIEATVFHTETIDGNKKLLRKIENFERSLEPNKRYSPQFEVSLDAGYSYDYTNRRGLVGDNLDLYNGLSHGLTTQVHANLLLSPTQGIGAVFNGFFADYNIGNGIIALRHNHYFGLNWHTKSHVNKRFLLSSDIGMGYSTHTVWGKYNNFKVKTDDSNGIGINIGIGCDYRISEYLGIGLKASLLTQSFSYIDSFTESGVMVRSEGYYNLNRLSITAGIRYYIGEAKPNLKPIIKNK